VVVDGVLDLGAEFSFGGSHVARLPVPGCIDGVY
jgi:hypothetical protein